MQWNAGGATYTFAVTRTQNGVTTPVRVLSPVLSNHQDLVMYDYEAARGVACTYAVTEVATYTVGSTSTLPGSAAPVTPSNDGTWWAKVPLNPALNVGAGLFRVQKGSLSYSRMEDQGQFRPLGRTRAVVVHGDLEGEDGGLTLEVFGAEWATSVYPVLIYQGTLLLQDPDGSQKYVALSSPRTWNRTAGATARRQAPLQYVEVDVP